MRYEWVVGPTAVRFKGFTTEPADGGGMVLTWRTGHEVSNLGFHVYRDGVRLTASPIAGSALLAGARTVLTAGNVYRWVDAEGTAASVYTLEDLDLNGTKTVHGPFGAGAATAPTRNLRRGAAADPLARLRGARPGVPRPGAEPGAANAAPASPLLDEVGRRGSADARWFSTSPGDVAPDGGDCRWRPWRSPPRMCWGRRIRWRVAISQQYVLARGPAVKLGVRAAGWYGVSAAQLVAAGMPAFVSPVTLQLFVNGTEQAILVRQAGGRVTADRVLRRRGGHAVVGHGGVLADVGRAGGAARPACT